MIRFVLLSFATVWAGAVQAAERELAGLSIPEERLAQDGTPLVLNGAGVRTKFFFDIYVGALYLPSRQTSSQEILQRGGPKRIDMHFVYPEVRAEKIVAGWNEGFAANHTRRELAELETRLRDFGTLFPTARAGDAIGLEYDPAAGTRVTHNGALLGTVPGEDFYRGLLKVWIGPEPVQKSLKAALLGRDR